MFYDEEEPIVVDKVAMKTVASLKESCRRMTAMRKNLNPLFKALRSGACKDAAQLKQLGLNLGESLSVSSTVSADPGAPRMLLSFQLLAGERGEIQLRAVERYRGGKGSRPVFWVSDDDPDDALTTVHEGIFDARFKPAQIAEALEKLIPNLEENLAGLENYLKA